MHPKIYIFFQKEFGFHYYGLNDNYHGTLKWFNEPIEDNQDDFYSSLIYLGHQVGVNKVLTPVENLRWSVGLRENVTSESIYQALAEIGLRGFEDSQCFSLSAGQQQRVSLSKLLLGTAIIWILDCLLYTSPSPRD